MDETQGPTIKDLLKKVPTSELIELLKTRSLTPTDIETLRSLRPTETIASSQTTIATGAGSLESRSTVEKFANAVIRKNVHGKLPAQTKINDIEINRSHVGGFYDHGPDSVSTYSLGNNTESLLAPIYEHQDRLPNLVNSSIVIVTPSTVDNKNMVLTIHFYQDKKQIDGRGWCTPAHVSAELSKDTMTELLEKLPQNPDLLEDFYQKVFRGLDSKDNLPGMRRVKSNGFFLIYGDKLDEVKKANKYDERTTRAFFESLKIHQYKHGPYGSGDIFQPR